MGVPRDCGSHLRQVRGFKRLISNRFAFVYLNFFQFRFYAFGWLILVDIDNLC